MYNGGLFLGTTVVICVDCPSALVAIKLSINIRCHCRVVQECRKSSPGVLPGKSRLGTMMDGLASCEVL